MAVETPAAVANLESILAFDGVDGIFVGPMDLVTNMGYLGDPSHARVQEAFADMEERVPQHWQGLGDDLWKLGAGTAAVRQWLPNGHADG
jgi:2-keto-3-deoxy-L-rhamnonate aldolase RhmA